jgi:hypothetical protein
MQDEEDFLAELIAERTKKNPNFPAMVEAALQRRRAARARGEDPNNPALAETEEDSEVESPQVAVSQSDS